MKKRTSLGRGLDALLDPSLRREMSGVAGDMPNASPVAEAPIGSLRPGRYQPRRRHSEEALAELADSIREQGVLQPLVVRPLASPAGTPADFEIVAGERRWRAAKIAGLATVPVIVRELDDQSALAVALIENLQREDLNPIDQAHSLSRLAGEFDLTHEQVAKAVGRSRSSVSNLLRLLELQDEVKDLLADGSIDMGHARALLSLDPARQVTMARKASKRRLSVRQVEKAVRDAVTAAETGGDTRAPADLQTRWLQQQIASEVGQSIVIRPTKEGVYALRVEFNDLERLSETLQKIAALVDQLRATAGPRARQGG